MYTSTIFISALFASALAAPLEKRQDSGITITFIGGPASYTLTIPTTDTWVETDSDLNISKLSSSADILTACEFQTNPPAALAATATYVEDDGDVDVGPPQPINAVKCS